MRFCEDLLQKWDKRIQFEATLLFFFSVVSGSSFVSIYMFFQFNIILNFIPLLYVTAMFCWWHTCKKMIFNTAEYDKGILISNGIAFILWIVITLSVSLGGWDEWGWETKDVDVPSADNVYRLMNCLLVTAFIGTLSYDYYKNIQNRNVRIKLWALYIWLHAIISFAYFVEWVIDAHTSGDYESIIPRWFATLGSGILILWGCPIFVMKKPNKALLYVLFIALVLYWWGSASLDCEFYADTADMTVMPGYQMLWTMAFLIVLETLPTVSTEIYVLGTEMLIDAQLDDNAVNTVIPASQQQMIDINKTDKL